MIRFGQKINTSVSTKNYFVTSDLHFWHKGVLGFCPDTRPWKGVEEMNEAIIEHWNSVVSVDDEVLHLGDFCFKAKEATEEVISKLKGNITFILGNHDKALRSQVSGIRCCDYLEFRFDGVKVCSMHFPLSSWNSQSRGSVMIHGHCLDMETEILTEMGWKTFSQITKGDLVYSYNSVTGAFENDIIKEKHLLEDYKGDVYTNETRKFSFRGTADHRLIGITVRGDYKECTVQEYVKTQTKLKFIRSGLLPSRSVALTDDELRLYICLAADGTIANTDLGRLRVSKSYKLKYFENILSDLEVPYTKNTQKDGSTCLNFTIPKNILNFNIKGLDSKLIDSSKNQTAIILEAYEVTDGYRTNGGNTVTIYTSKAEEKDLLQQLFTLRGYQCTVGVRGAGHGFSKTDNFELNVTEKQYQISEPDNFKVSKSSGEDFWCVTTRNGNFICRRKGKVHVTGNCHGSFQGKGRILDCGWDVHGRTIELQEAIDMCLLREVYCHDHHKVV